MVKDDWRPFVEARKFVRKLKLKNAGEWEQYSKSGERPDDIPSSPRHTYKKEWTTWGDWLGTGTIANQVKSKNWLPIKEAKVEASKIAIELGIKTREQWIEAYRAGRIPKNLPSDLRKIYSGRRRRK